VAADVNNTIPVEITDHGDRTGVAISLSPETDLALHDVPRPRLNQIRNTCSIIASNIGSPVAIVIAQRRNNARITEPEGSKSSRALHQIPGARVGPPRYTRSIKHCNIGTSITIIVTGNRRCTKITEPEGTEARRAAH